MDPQTHRRQQDKGRSPHNRLTINGPVTIQRRHYYSRHQGTSTPADAFLDAAAAMVSLGVREMCARLNAGAKSFAKAAENLVRAAQIPMSRETLRTIVEHDGKLALQYSHRGDLAVSWTARDCPGPQGQSLVYLSSDGFTAPLVTDAEKRQRRQQTLQRRRRCGKKRRSLPRLKPGADQRYKEFKVVAFYDQTMEHRLVSVTKGDCNQAGLLMRRDAERIEFALANQRVGNIDGGPWIIGQIRKRRLPMTATGLDFYHLSQNVHKARRGIFGEEDATGKQRAGDLLHVAKHEGYESLWEQLLALRKQSRGPAKRKAADGLLHYVSDRREMIRYPEFLAHGWQIGSGPIESQCRVVPDRVKGPGKRWDADNAEAVMALEAADQSNLWSQLWAIGLHHRN